MASFLKNILKKQNYGAIVLMYHRITNSLLDPWDLCVTPENLEEHILWLKKKEYTVIPMHALAQRVHEKKSLHHFVSLTFDDGYLDNYTHAKPILEKYETPATFYFTTNFQVNKKYWWDELEKIFLTSNVLPTEINIELNEKQFSFFLEADHVLNENTRKQILLWRYGHPFYNKRLELYFKVWMEIKTMSLQSQQKALGQIKVWAGGVEVETPPIMNESHIKEMAKKPFLEIGAHTINHPALGSLSSSQQKKELTESKSILEDIIQKEVKGIAYPYGHYNEATPQLAQSAHFKYAVTTAETIVNPYHSRYEIPRFQVKNLGGKEFINTMKSWQRK